ncbi:MAG TPA: PLP-dependent aspartate aminotransferase family protein, partial [Myxococcales bacterium]|nr:PLP-dependent aspartate aminotransferase family protein [Myxococcales bacterium]
MSGGGPRRTRTVAVHAGERLEGSRAIPVAAAIHTSSVSYFDEADALDAALDGKDYSYTRIRGQNAALLEEAVAALEGTEDCAAFPTGMAALKALLESLALKPSDAVAIPNDCYGASLALVKAFAQERGAAVNLLSMTAPQTPGELRRLKPRLVLAESVTNPLLSVPDLPALAEACRDAGATFAVDATFPSPALHRAASFGADLVLQSTTKWLNGHSDAMGGTVSGPRDRIAPLKSARVLHGAVLGPFEAWLTLRGVRTLPVRMAAHSAGAMRVAERLKASALVEKVIYPGLPEHPQHAVARRMLEGGFGGMLAFELKGAGRAQGFRFLEQVRLCRPAPSLGDVTTLVMHAATASARRMTPEERAAAGIRESLIRVSVGLEDPDDVADDLL